MPGRVRVTEAFLMRRLAEARPYHPVQTAASSILRTRGAQSVADLARATGMSPRHFERAFEEQVGVTPKLYARIVRLNHALTLKKRPTQPGWAAVAHEAGYYDQSHMVKDFRALSGGTPSEFVRRPHREPSVIEEALRRGDGMSHFYYRA